jgi:dipeptidase E
MQRKLVLASCIDKILPKVSFIFDKPLNKLKVTCIPTAANVYAEADKDWLDREMQSFYDLGIALDKFDLVGKNKSDVEQQLNNSDVVYVTGGNTYYLLEHMKKCDFKSVITDRVNNGLIYIGGSAGAITACPQIDFIRNMDDKSEASLDNFDGLNLVDLKIMPHIDHDKYGSMAKEILKDMRSDNEYFIGLRDSQALVIMDNYIEIYG